MSRMLGPYQIRSELGRGAMAVVWRAWDPTLEREVALKEPVIPHGLDSSLVHEFSARFVQEGKAAAKLAHPGIVTIYAADIYEGRPVLVMELIEGESLGHMLTRGPVAPALALGILEQLLDAVGYAHSHAIIHRDIKPDNVFLTHDGRVKLTDFGIAHVGDTASLTQAGTVMGTPGYMAPEQITGAQVDRRADLFAIGVLAYEMLSGQNPFGAGGTLPATTVMYRIVHESAPPLSPIALGELPVDLRPVIGAALAKDPAHRFQDANGFRAALRGGPLPADASPLGLTEADTGSEHSQGTHGWLTYVALAAVAVIAFALLMLAGPAAAGAVAGVGALLVIVIALVSRSRSHQALVGALPVRAGDGGVALEPDAERESFGAAAAVSGVKASSAPTLLERAGDGEAARAVDADDSRRAAATIMDVKRPLASSEPGPKGEPGGPEPGEARAAAGPRPLAGSRPVRILALIGTAVLLACAIGLGVFFSTGGPSVGGGSSGTSSGAATAGPRDSSGGVVGTTSRTAVDGASSTSSAGRASTTSVTEGSAASARTTEPTTTTTPGSRPSTTARSSTTVRPTPTTHRPTTTSPNGPPSTFGPGG